MDLDFLKKTDPEIFDLVKKELERQRNGLQLISAENHASIAIMEAAGTWLTNKYSEGYPGKKYYGGNQFIDIIETIAIERAKKLFNMEHANVQPNSGSPANMACYYAFMELGDKFMSLNLTNGGHLTHGHPVNFSGKWYKPCFYDIEPDTYLIDYDKLRKQAEKEKPKLILAGFTVYPREVKFKEIAEIAKDVGAYFMADISHTAGLVVTGNHISPAPEADVIMTTTHKTLRGPRSAVILCKNEYAKKIDRAVFPGLQGGPLNHIIAAKAVCFKEAMTPEFKNYQDQIVKNARVLAKTLVDNGFNLITGGTDTHTMLGDVTPFGLSGREAQDLLESVGIYVNKNMIPFDKRKPMDPSGLRIGVPPVTTRGMKESEMKLIGEMIIEVLKNKDNEAVKNSVKERVLELCNKFPLYPEIEI
ncbi:MAG: serine hydroxymethyltransferase [Candidatus Aenigmatarchaeota archaeon]